MWEAGEEVAVAVSCSEGRGGYRFFFVGPSAGEVGRGACRGTLRTTMMYRSGIFAGVMHTIFYVSTVDLPLQVHIKITTTTTEISVPVEATLRRFGSLSLSLQCCVVVNSCFCSSHPRLNPIA